MANPPQTVVVEKKRGMGCCGCGCLILFILAILFVVLIGGMGYVGYSKINGFTTTHPLELKTFDGGDDLYRNATQKLTDFDQAVQHHQPTTLHLNADEINTMIARDPDFKNNNIHLFVTLNGSEAELKVSAPLDGLNLSVFKGRYLSGTITSGIDFDPQNKTLNLLLKNCQIGNQSAPKEYLSLIQSEIDPAFNQMLLKDPIAQNVLDQAKTIEIKDSELVIKTE